MYHQKLAFIRNRGWMELEKSYVTWNNMDWSLIFFWELSILRRNLPNCTKFLFLATLIIWCNFRVKNKKKCMDVRIISRKTNVNIEWGNGARGKWSRTNVPETYTNLSDDVSKMDRHGYNESYLASLVPKWWKEANEAEIEPHRKTRKNIIKQLSILWLQ